ncbi:hypothetical protein ER70_07980 (plasmid) [Borreliella bissettiae]|uniref:Uncharacterized protein n=1 Tax=Borrelia bissettiae TaxID=64897 RepID=A0A1L8ZA03_BORBI|nr:hypothetical protein ER70_07980 [Borreliella bissettiae]
MCLLGPSELLFLITHIKGDNKHMLETKVNENDLYNELVRLGMNKILASDLATRFYHNKDNE